MEANRNKLIGTAIGIVLIAIASIPQYVQQLNAERLQREIQKEWRENMFLDSWNDGE